MATHPIGQAVIAGRAMARTGNVGCAIYPCDASRAGMTVDIATVHRIAALARIAITDEEAARFAPEFAAIIGWIEQLGEVDVAGVEPMTAVIATAGAGGTAGLRPDLVTDGGMAEAVLANAPAAEHGFFTVPKVIE